MFSPKVCEECKGLCIPIAVSYNLMSSEHYCKKCHKSYPMDMKEANEVLNEEAATLATARRRK